MNTFDMIYSLDMSFVCWVLQKQTSEPGMKATQEYAQYRAG